jgi:hypothetical protein
MPSIDSMVRSVRIAAETAWLNDKWLHPATVVGSVAGCSIWLAKQRRQLFRKLCVLALAVCPCGVPMKYTPHNKDGRYRAQFHGYQIQELYETC